MASSSPWASAANFLTSTSSSAEAANSFAITATNRSLRTRLGNRVSELSNLTLSDVETSERKGSLTVRSGKGGKFRVLPLNVDARRAVASYLEVRPTVSIDRLFVGQRGEGVSSRAVELLVSKYARLANLEGVTPHTLRHSFGKHALDAGADLVSVAALLGHERLETTAVYTTPSQRDLARVVEKLEQDGDRR